MVRRSRMTLSFGLSCVAILHCPKPEDLSQLADILEFCAFTELMVSVQPDFNQGPFPSLAHNSNALFQYLQLVQTRLATRRLITDLAQHYRLQTSDGSHRAITWWFLRVLQRTASELFYLLSQFQSQPPKRHKMTSTAHRVHPHMTEDHYLFTGMKRTHMLANLKRVLGHWELVVENPRAKEWGSVQVRSGQFQVLISTSPGSMQEKPDRTPSSDSRFCHLILPY
jgi:hypothetical protein